MNDAPHAPHAHPEDAGHTAPTSHAVVGAPCWVSLTSRDLGAATSFYQAVLGWEWRATRLGERFRIALADGAPVAGIADESPEWPMPVVWTSYFAVRSADEAVSRVRERGGTAAVGPLSFPPGRAALLADRDGAAFGVWEGELVTDWEAWRRVAPAYVGLHTRDAFEAAIFYGQVLDWASDLPGHCQVTYEGDQVVLRSEGDVMARISSGALEEAPDPTIRPHWQVHFAVPDVSACAKAAEEHGGSVLRQNETEAVLCDPDGAHFTVTPRADAG
ncbi:hypothetical protein GCM10010145_51090 [Streptomyces ruber]|uniref:VOC domain-containing protein n=2 Tax=Streptomyces TaxID=1883 RepID=A0A918BLN4_9ACTN|nr:VOC family protein [Streptomyces ruber]GGQ75309.1 hypothetical protein GCM10010145_51090 [Streptomyces ruber]